MFTSFLHTLRWFASVVLVIGAGAACSQSVDSSPSYDRTRAFLKLEEIQPVPRFRAVQEVETTEPGEEASHQYQRGREFFDQKRWTRAISAFKKAAEQNPRWVDVRIRLARACLQTGDLETAESHLDEAVKHRPADVALHQLRGEIAWRQGEAVKAIRSFRLALMASEDEPDRPERVLAHVSLGMALRKEGYLCAAVDQLEAYLAAADDPTPAMEQHPELNEAISRYRGHAAGLIGEIQTELQDYKNAAAAYERAVAQKPDDVGLRRCLAVSLLRLGRGPEALETVRQMPAGTPSATRLSLLKDICDASGQPEQYDAELTRLAWETADPDERLELVELLVLRGKIAAGIDVLEGAAAKGPLEAEAGYLLANLFFRRGDADKALDITAETLRAQPATYRQAAETLADAGDALAVSSSTDGPGQDGTHLLVGRARRLSRQRADDVVLQFICGQALLLDGQHDEALEAFHAAARLDEDFGPAFVATARLSIEAKRWSQAVKAVDAAIDAGLGNVDTYLLKGRAHEALDEHEEAEAALLEAFKLDRTSPQALYLLAESAERHGHPKRCEQLYRRILDEVDPRFIPARERLVRLYLNTGRLARAVEYFADFNRLNLTGPAEARCRAYLAFVASRSEGKRAGYREAYQAELHRIIAEYPRDTRTHVDLALTHSTAGEYQQALDEVERALEINEHYSVAQELKAALEAKLLRFDSAAAICRKLLEDRPRSARVHQQLLELAKDKGDYDAAVTMLQRLLTREDLQQHHASFKGQLVEAMVMTDRADEAADVAKDWLDEAPDDALRRTVYLVALNKAGRHDEAIDSAAFWLAEDPADPELRRQLSGQLANADRHVEAQQHVLSWLADDPDVLPLNEELIRLCLLAEQWDSAIELALAGKESVTHQDRYEDWLCRSYILAKRFDEAVASYQDRLNVLESFRRRSERRGDIVSHRLYYQATKSAYRNLITTLITGERFVEAEQIATRLLLSQIEQRDAGENHDGAWVVGLRRYLAGIFQLTDRRKQAVQQLEEIFALTPRDPGINNDLGYTWADAGTHLDRAERMIRFAVGEEPRVYAYLDSLGWVLYKRGRIDEAIHHLRLAIRRADDADAVVHDHLGDALYRAGRPEEAETRWEKALELAEADDDSAQAAEDRRLQESVRTKLEQLRNGEPVDVAPIAGAAASTAGESAARSVIQPTRASRPSAAPTDAGSSPGCTPARIVAAAATPHYAPCMSSNGA